MSGLRDYVVGFTQSASRCTLLDLNIESKSLERKKANKLGSSRLETQKKFLERLAAVEAALEAEQPAAVASASKAREVVAQAEAQAACLYVQLNHAWML